MPPSPSAPMCYTDRQGAGRRRPEGALEFIGGRSVPGTPTVSAPEGSTTTTLSGSSSREGPARSCRASPCRARLRVPGQGVLRIGIDRARCLALPSARIEASGPKVAIDARTLADSSVTITWAGSSRDQAPAGPAAAGRPAGRHPAVAQGEGGTLAPGRRPGGDACRASARRVLPRVSRGGPSVHRHPGADRGFRARDPTVRCATRAHARALSGSHADRSGRPRTPPVDGSSRPVAREPVTATPPPGPATWSPDAYATTAGEAEPQATPPPTHPTRPAPDTARSVLGRGGMEKVWLAWDRNCCGMWRSRPSTPIWDGTTSSAASRPRRRPPPSCSIQASCPSTTSECCRTAGRLHDAGRDGAGTPHADRRGPYGLDPGPVLDGGRAVVPRSVRCLPAGARPWLGPQPGVVHRDLARQRHGRGLRSGAGGRLGPREGRRLDRGPSDRGDGTGPDQPQRTPDLPPAMAGSAAAPGRGTRAGTGTSRPLDPGPTCSPSGNHLHDARGRAPAR